MLATTPLDVVLDDGLRIVRDAIVAGIADEGHLAAAGVEVVSVRVVGVRPDDELERALQTKVREEVQAEADRATYDRRAQAVDRERAIKENELNNRTELARREARLVELDGANERRRAEQAVERDKLAVDAQVDRNQRLSAAENAALAERLALYSDADLAAVLATIGPELVASMPKIDALTITPDMLSGALAKALAGMRAA